MSSRNWERVTAIAGIVTVFLFVAEIATWGNPEYGDPVSKIRTVFVDNQRMAYVSIELAAWSLVAMLVFAAGLAAILRRLRPDNEILAPVIVGSAAIFGAAQIAFGAVSGALALGAAHATDSEINLIQAVLTYLDALRFMPFGLMTVVAGIAQLSAPGFARWIGWVAIASGAANLVAQLSMFDPMGALGHLGSAGQLGFLLYIIWTVAIAVTLFRRPLLASSRPMAAGRAEAVSE